MHIVVEEEEERSPWVLVGIAVAILVLIGIIIVMALGLAGIFSNTKPAQGQALEVATGNVSVAPSLSRFDRIRERGYVKAQVVSPFAYPHR